MTRLADCVTFKRRDLAARYADRKIPMSTLLEAYLDEQLDIVDMEKFLDARESLVSYTLTPAHVEQLITRLVPEWAVHSLAIDTRLVREHYDRGDDFFAAFLGERMVYTSGYFTSPYSSLEECQDAKLDRVCQKLRLEPEHALLDVGCGWGTLALHAARDYGVAATGVTLSQNQTAFGNARIASAGLTTRARLECLDYRQIPGKKYDRIVSLEMVEHVGLKNLSKFFELLYDRLEDNGLFLLQFAGLRRGGPLGVPPVGMRPEDMIWGLFMNKYIFPGSRTAPTFASNTASVASASGTCSWLGPRALAARATRNASKSSRTRTWTHSIAGSSSAPPSRRHRGRARPSSSGRLLLEVHDERRSDERALTGASSSPSSTAPTRSETAS